MRQEGGKKVVRSRLPELGAVVFEVGDLSIKSLLHGRDWERVKEVKFFERRRWAIHERHVVLHKQLLPLQISREQL
jgi:hypothetical protein